MKLVDSMMRSFVLMRGSGSRWLRQELDTLHVSIRLTDGCLNEFVRDADEAVAARGSSPEQTYVEQLRQELTDRAHFIQLWTGSDEDIVLQGEEGLQSNVRIARKYALPRRWKLSEPVVVEYQRMRPSYLQWTDDLETGALPQV
jgi:hypothetical protein